MNPTHRVTVERESPREVRSHLCFGLTHAEVYLAVYEALGWFGVIVEVGRNG